MSEDSFVYKFENLAKIEKFFFMEIGDKRRLEYLNLELKTGKVRRSIDDVEIFCFSQNQHKHKFHSENTHLNSLSDICYQLLYNFDCERSSHTSLFQSFYLLFQNQKQKIDVLSEKLDFLRDQQNVEIPKRLPTKEDIEVLLQRLDQKETIQQLSLEVSQLNKKLQSLEKLIQKLF